MPNLSLPSASEIGFTRLFFFVYCISHRIGALVLFISFPLIPFGVSPVREPLMSFTDDTLPHSVVRY